MSTAAATIKRPNRSTFTARPDRVGWSPLAVLDGHARCPLGDHLIVGTTT